MFVSEKTYNEFWKEHEKAYSVWVGCNEVNNYYLSHSDAQDLADEYIEDGYDDVHIEKLAIDKE
jgi:hypothetical protein